MFQMNAKLFNECWPFIAAQAAGSRIGTTTTTAELRLRAQAATRVESATTIQPALTTGNHIMEGKFRLLLRGRERPGPMRQQTYAAEDSVDVRDLMTCATQHVRADELSPYRHALILDGMEYQILNVLRQ